jgi:hypothetical protein
MTVIFSQITAAARSAGWNRGPTTVVNVQDSDSKFNAVKMPSETVESTSNVTRIYTGLTETALGYIAIQLL